MGRLISTVCAMGLLAAACGSSDGVSSDSTSSGDATVESTTTSAAPEEFEETEAAPAAEVTDGDAVGDPSTFFPEVLDVQAEPDGDGSWTFSVTLSSPYDTPEQYADAWRVVGPDGTELGFRLLTHDHANEQPFTRSQGGIVVPDGVDTVTIEARDLVNGWASDTFEFALPD